MFIDDLNYGDAVLGLELAAYFHNLSNEVTPRITLFCSDTITGTFYKTFKNYSDACITVIDNRRVTTIERTLVDLIIYGASSDIIYDCLQVFLHTNSLDELKHTAELLGVLDLFNEKFDYELYM